MKLSAYREVSNACKRSKVAYLDKKIITNLYKKSKYYDGNKQEAQGFLYYDNKNIYVTFRGTMDLNDVKEIIDIRHQNLFTPHVKVHKGFYNQFFSIEENMSRDIFDIIKSYPVNDIIFTGHSAGGCTSMIAGAYYGHLIDCDIGITTITFGSTCTGNMEFVKLFLNNVDKHIRVENYLDIVPLIPIHTNFTHVPNKMLLHNDGTLFYNQNLFDQIDYKMFIEKVIMQKSFEDLCNNHSCKAYFEHLIASYKNYPDVWNNVDI